MTWQVYLWPGYILLDLKNEASVAMTSHVTHLKQMTTLHGGGWEIMPGCQQLKIAALVNDF